MGRSRGRPAAARPRPALGLAETRELVGRADAEERLHPFRDRFTENMVVECMKKLFPIRSAIEKVPELFPDRVGFRHLGNATTEN